MLDKIEEVKEVELEKRGDCLRAPKVRALIF